VKNKLKVRSVKLRVNTKLLIFNNIKRGLFKTSRL